MASVAGYRSRFTDGWFRHDGQEPDYLQSMSHGFWTITEPDFNISGNVLGKSLISGQSNIWWNLLPSVSGKGLISSEFVLGETYVISGSGLGKGKISSDCEYFFPIVISGVAIGKGKPFHRLNYSKTKTLNPILKAQNYGYETSDCPLVAIEYQGFSPNKIIDILDYSDTIYENTDSYYAIESVEYSGAINKYPLNHYSYSSISSGLIDYLVTDIRSDNQNGDPLFYQYELLYDAKSITNDTLITNIYRNNETVVDKSKYEIQTSTELLSNGNSRYDSTSWNTSEGNFETTVKRTRVLLPLDFNEEKEFYTIEYKKVVNGITSYQKELIELKPLYNKGSDFNITESGISLPNSGNISNSQTLMIVKDPRYQIYPLGINAIKDQDSFTSYVSDATSSWNLRLNTGSFLQASGFYTNESEKFYYLPNTNTTTPIPLTNIKPQLYGSNVLKVDSFPLFIDTSSTGFSYPNYKVPVYDKTRFKLDDPVGKIAIDVNGITRSDIEITSIDREKGFLLLNTDLFPSDEIELAFYIENSANQIIENLELNPKVDDGTTEFHISDYMNGLGIALLEYDGSTNSTYPYIYDSTTDESSRIAYSIPPIGISGVSVPWISGNFFTICELNINRLTKDMINLTDARRIGGGLDIEKVQKWFNQNFGGSYRIHESEWYTNNGYYDGEPLAHNGVVVLHIPETNLSGLRQQWIDYYSEEMNQERAQELGDKEFKFYLDQTIKRYISAGSDYIILPTLSGQITDIYYLE